MDTDGMEIRKVSDITGKKVVNLQGEDLGEIEELVVDETDARIAYAVLSFGGILGIGDKLFAIPWDMLSYGHEDEYVLDVDKRILKEAPGFDKNNWPALGDRTWMSGIFAYYNREPYWL